MDCSPPGSSVHGDSSGKNTGVGCHALLQEIFSTQADSLLSEPQGKPKNTGVGSLSLLQGIFLTQESNQCFLHYRQILYQLSYQGSPVQFSSVAQSCPTLCDPMNRSPPGLPVHHQLPGTVQSRDQHKSRNCPRSHRKFLSQTRAEAGVLSTTSLSTCS